MTNRFNDLCNAVAADLIEKLEAGGTDGFCLPWQKSFTEPVNALTGSTYRGMNWVQGVVLCASQGWDSGSFATYRQWQTLGRQVAKGSKGLQMVRWIEKKDDDDDEGDEIKMFPVCFTVFSAEQLTEDEEAKWQPSKMSPCMIEGQKDLAVEKWIEATGAEIRHGGDRAFYNRKGDYIAIPEWEKFNASGDYYSTIAHELTHWSGNENRLNREGITEPANPERYAFEELVAEFGSAMLCAAMGCVPSPRSDHEKYLSHWVKAIKSDPKTLWKAAGQAQKAVDYLQQNNELKVS